MRKTMFRWLIALAILLPCMVVTVFATDSERAVTASGYCGGEGDRKNLTWTLYENGELVIEGSGLMYNFYFNDSSPWYPYRESIKTVNIGNDVTQVGANAFCDCTGLTSVTIPGGVRNIGLFAFMRCTNLAEVTIGNGVTDIGRSAFNGCTGLTRVTIPDSVTSIGNSAFQNCTNLTSITIPDNVTSVGNNAFQNCTNLTSITIPDGVTSIGDHAFAGCAGLTSVTIPDSVTNIGLFAFMRCTNLAEVTIGNSVTSIGWGAFNGCIGLTSVTIPASVTEIGQSAFSACSKLDINVAPENQNFCAVDNVLFTKDMRRLLVSSAKRTDATYAIPEQVTAIDGWAFFNVTSLREVTIPAGVTDIGASVFYNCGLEQIRLAEENTSFALVDGALYTADMKRLISYEAGNSRTALHIPEGVETIDDGALRQAKRLVSLCLPDSVTASYIDLFGDIAMRTLVVGSGISEVSLKVGYGSVSLADVYYTGDESGWNTLVNNGTDDLLRNVTVHFATREQLCDPVATKVPTCTEPGFAESGCCTICGKELEVQMELPALGHDLVHHQGKVPTADSAGWKDYDDCTRCDYSTYKELQAGQQPAHFKFSLEVVNTVVVDGKKVEICRWVWTPIYE